MDLLTTADETDHDAPPRDPLGELDEVLGAERLATAQTRGCVCVSSATCSASKRPLGLIEDEDVLRWGQVAGVRSRSFT